VGKQRYLACSLYHLSEAERAKWESLTSGKELKTRIFVDPTVDSVARFLDERHAVRQTPLAKDGLGGGTGNRLPPPDGLMNLTDGTAVRVKGASPDLAGDAISGELETGGVKVAYAARGLFAARVIDGKMDGFCGGEVTRVEAPDLSLVLDEPADIALVKIGGEWHGVWQTPDVSAPVPSPLLRVTSHWVKLRGLSSPHGKKWQ